MDKDIQLILNNGKKPRVIDFRLARNRDEIEEIARLRARVYSRRNYFSEPKDFDEDEFDRHKSTLYFYAKYNGKIIGALRVIRERPFPTERFFLFSESEVMGGVPKEKRCEVGRLVVERPDGEYFPRNLIMIFLILRLTRFAQRNQLLDAGYSFIKESLQRKFSKIRLPFHRIIDYKQNYPADGMLFRYFNDPSDRVLPAYFFTGEVMRHLEKIIKQRFLIQEHEDGVFVLKNSLYTKVLTFFKII
jgi:N-acyl-L-homoserine lactone synthetase